MRLFVNATSTTSDKIVVKHFFDTISGFILGGVKNANKWVPNAFLEDIFLLNLGKRWCLLNLDAYKSKEQFFHIYDGILIIIEISSVDVSARVHHSIPLRVRYVT